MVETGLPVVIAFAPFESSMAKVGWRVLGTVCTAGCCARTARIPNAVAAISKRPVRRRALFFIGLQRGDERVKGEG
jgi:hypothetical protein